MESPCWFLKWGVTWSYSFGSSEKDFRERIPIRQLVFMNRNIKLFLKFRVRDHRKLNLSNGHRVGGACMKSVEKVPPAV